MTPDATIPSTDGPRIMPLVVGATRSGTTLLRLMLDSHPQVAIPSETSFPAGLFEAALVESGEAIADRVIAADHWADLRLDAEAYRARCRGRSGVEALRLVWRTYGDVHAKPIVGDKSPEYVSFLPTIARVIPELRVIHLVRDGRDCFASRRHSRPFLRSSAIEMPAEQASAWSLAIRSGREAARAIESLGGRSIEIRYEALILEPEPELRRISEFLGVDFDPRMLAHVERADDRLAESTLDEPRIGRWRETLLEDEVAAYEAIAGPLLAELGYEASSSLLARQDEAAACGHDAAAKAALERRDYPSALRSAIRALRATPRSRGRAESVLQLAKWTDDLPTYWRMQVARTSRMRAKFDGRLPHWRGEPLGADRRLLITSPARHLGIDLRMSAILANLDSLAPHCTLAVDPRVAPLVRRRFPALEVLPIGGLPPDARYQATWELLGHYLMPSVAALPSGPWLEADSVRTAAFARRTRSRPRVAFSWHSPNEKKELPPPAIWRRLLEVEGIEWVSVQHSCDPRTVPEWHGLADRIVVEDLDLRDDLDGLAALLRSCDLAIGVSSSVMHLAGALGVPAWMIARELPHLSWTLGKERTPWYPKTRCHWVRDPAEWETQVARIADELVQWTSMPRSEREVR